MKLEKFLNAYPVWAAYKLHERLVVPMQKRFKEQNISFLQSLILAAIYFEDAPVSPSNLVAIFGTSLPNMSHSLKHLRLLGLVERKVDTLDSRKIRYALTPHAKNRLEHIINLHHHAQEYLETVFSESEITKWCTQAAEISSTRIISEAE